jgi:hypothetical protein
MSDDDNKNSFGVEMSTKESKNKKFIFRGQSNYSDLIKENE